MTQNVLSPDLTVRDLNNCAKVQSGRLRLALGSDAGRHPAFVLAQAVKLAEESVSFKPKFLVMLATSEQLKPVLYR